MVLLRLIPWDGFNIYNYILVISTIKNMEQHNFHLIKYGQKAITHQSEIIILENTRLNSVSMADECYLLSSIIQCDGEFHKEALTNWNQNHQIQLIKTT